MRKSPLIVVILLAVVTAGAAWGLSRVLSNRAASPTGAARIVSLSPAVTDTLFAIGAGDQVVAVTDYDDFPPQVKNMPRAGTILTPNYEAIARLQPGLIIGQTTQHISSDEKLATIAPTTLLEWLTLDDICKGIRELGRMSGHQDAADKLADTMQQRLSVAAPEDAPRVLLCMPLEPGAPKELFFIQQNSIHGACLRAAGARNAIERDISGAATLGVEELLRTDPDAVVLLLPQEGIDDATRKAYIDGWSKLATLRAVKNKKIAILAGPQTLADGPRILTFLDELKAALKDLKITS